MVTKEIAATYRHAYYIKNRSRLLKKQREYNRKNIKQVASRLHDYYEKNKESIKYLTRKRKKQLNNDVFDIYGGKCSCCGESNRVFLTLDHVGNDGAKDRGRRYSKHSRRYVRSDNSRIFYAIRKSGKPLPQYQILCFNCNCGKHRNGGICPHVTSSPRSA